MDAEDVHSTTKSVCVSVLLSVSPWVITTSHSPVTCLSSLVSPLTPAAAFYIPLSLTLSLLFVARLFTHRSVSVLVFFYCPCVCSIRPAFPVSPSSVLFVLHLFSAVCPLCSLFAPVSLPCPVWLSDAAPVLDLKCPPTLKHLVYCITYIYMYIYIY